MALKDVTPRFEEIAYGGAVIRLHPLAFWQVCQMFTSNAGSLVPAMAAFKAATESGDATGVLPALIEGIANNRRLIDLMIVTSARGGPTELTIVERLPASVQCQALLIVIRLTWGLDFSAFMPVLPHNDNFISRSHH